MEFKYQLISFIKGKNPMFEIRRDGYSTFVSKGELFKLMARTMIANPYAYKATRERGLI